MAISDIVVALYLVNACFLSALINTFYKSTIVIDCPGRTSEIKYLILFFLLAVARDGENTRTDLKNSFLKWSQVGQNKMKCSRSSTSDWHIGQTGAEGCLYLQVARTFMSTRSLVKSITHFVIFITDRYVLRSCSFLHWFRYIYLLDAGILLFRDCWNCSFNLWTNVFPKFGVIGAGDLRIHHQTHFMSTNT